MNHHAESRFERIVTFTLFWKSPWASPWNNLKPAANSQPNYRQRARRAIALQYPLDLFCFNSYPCFDFLTCLRYPSAELFWYSLREGLVDTTSISCIWNSWVTNMTEPKGKRSNYAIGTHSLPSSSWGRRESVNRVFAGNNGRAYWAGRNSSLNFYILYSFFHLGKKRFFDFRKYFSFIFSLQYIDRIFSVLEL